MVAGGVECSCQLVVTFFFVVSPYETIEIISLGQPSPPSYQLLAPPLSKSKYFGALESSLYCCFDTWHDVTHA